MECYPLFQLPSFPLGLTWPPRLIFHNLLRLDVEGFTVTLKDSFEDIFLEDSGRIFLFLVITPLFLIRTMRVTRLRTLKEQVVLKSSLTSWSLWTALWNSFSSLLTDLRNFLLLAGLHFSALYLHSAQTQCMPLSLMKRPSLTEGISQRPSIPPLEKAFFPFQDHYTVEWLFHSSSFYSLSDF